MKQLIIMTIIIIVIPLLVVSCLKEEIFNYNGGIVSRNTIRVKRNSTGQIEKIPLEQYIKGVVAGEMPVTFHIEALKAQAVAARSYALKRINNSKEYDVVDTVLNQVYKDNNQLKKTWGNNYNKYMKILNEVIKETEGEYLVYNNQVIDALFFSTSNGYTENSEEIFANTIPYLRSVKSEWDSNTSPVFNDYFTFTLKDFYTRLNLKYSDKLVIDIPSKTSTGRALSITINGTKMNAVTFQNKLGIRSTDFYITKEEDTVYIKTKGFGHGVGLSQYGANGMAKEGYTYKEILTHYYQGVDFKKI